MPNYSSQIPATLVFVVRENQGCQITDYSYLRTLDFVIGDNQGCQIIDFNYLYTLDL